MFVKFGPVCVMEVRLYQGRSQKLEGACLGVGIVHHSEEDSVV